MIQNIIFDLGGVVVDFAPREFLVDHFLNERLENILYDITFGSEEWLRLDTGELTREEANAIMREKGAAIGRRYEVDVILSDWYDMLRTKEDTVQLMKRLKSNGYSLYYLSNIPPDVLELLSARKFWRLFDGGVASCEAGLAKPDRRIFRRLLEEYDLKPSECVFTDDVKINAAAASDVGILGVHFRSARVFARSLAAHGVTVTRKHPARKAPEKDASAPAPAESAGAENADAGGAP